jgi:sulfite exporter TauE/SafE
VVTLIASILASSLLGSPHCAAMCGGFACFYAREPGVARPWLGPLAYHGGRLASYALLGVLAGALGAGVNAAGRMAGATRVAAVLAGMLMVGWGVATILRALGARLPRAAPLGPARNLLQRAIRRMKRRPPVLRAATLGLLTTLLPCGWLYVFVATAGGTGSPGRGALVMTAFWLGTVPLLAGLGAAVQRLSGPFRQRLPMLTAAVLVVIGLLTAAGRIGTALGDAADSAARIHDHR